jgi:hypothetical protein
MIQLGRHLWATCSDCGKLVKLTGWLRGVHLCLTDEEIAAKRRQAGSGTQATKEHAEATHRSAAQK